jgi:hypothetical protein
VDPLLALLGEAEPLAQPDGDVDVALVVDVERERDDQRPLGPCPGVPPRGGEIGAADRDARLRAHRAVHAVQPRRHRGPRVGRPSPSDGGSTLGRAGRRREHRGERRAPRLAEAAAASSTFCDCEPGTL